MEEITLWGETKKGGKIVERFDPTTTSINLGDKRIGSIDLAPLDQFLNLEVLTLSGNEIQTLDLSVLHGNGSLLELNLGSNELEIIDLSPLENCTGLMHLDLSFNKLRTLDLAPLGGCGSLQALHLYENKIERIDLSPLKKCKRLRNLTLTKNELTSLDISALFDCPSLMQLGLDSEVVLTAAAKFKGAKTPRALAPLLGTIQWR
jgi:Leucine-rich repeat (LRR) protein